MISSLLDRFDAAKIFVAASVVAISVEYARCQLQSHIAVDVMIECLDQRFTDAIAAEGCAIPRLFLERTIARLPPTLGGVYSAAMIACDETPVSCERLSPEGTLSVALVFCFRFRRTTRSVKSLRCSIANSTRVRSRNASVCYVPIPYRDSVALASAAAQSADASSSQALNPLRRSNLSCRPQVPLIDHSSRSPLRAFRLQARLLSCSVRRSLAVHLSRSSRRQEHTPRLTRVIRGLHCRSRVSSRSRRVT